MDKKQKAIENTVFGTWAQDAYKRQITLTPQEAAAVSRRPHKKRYVGMFYFAWVGQQGERHEDVYDIEQLLKTNPKALWDPSGPPEAPLYMNYFLQNRCLATIIWRIRIFFAGISNFLLPQA